MRMPQGYRRVHRDLSVSAPNARLPRALVADLA
jgi:hypothetical protein